MGRRRRWAASGRGTMEMGATPTMTTVGRDERSNGAGLNRRAFLAAGGVGLGTLGLSLPERAARAATPPSHHRALILLMMVGGPSQLETWDPKPDAPEEVRGPFSSIATRVPGVRINEHLPRLAARMDKVALIRSVHHREAPIHETGLQLIQTGRLSRTEDEHPHLGAVASLLLGSAGSRPLPASILLPGPIVNTGVQIPRGQTAGRLGAEHEPFSVGAVPGAADYRPGAILRRAGGTDLGRAANPFDLGAEPDRLRDAYGATRFGRSCLLARRLVEAGTRVVTVNMFDSVFDQVTWDCHGAGPFSTLDDYKRQLLPTFDRAFSTLLDDLESRGLLETTMVAAVGEFGRTPRINSSGGRDHWPGVWSVALAGGGVRGGQVVGASDDRAAEPVDRPVSPGELLASMHHALGIDPATALDGAEPLVDAAPVYELFS